MALETLDRCSPHDLPADVNLQSAQDTVPTRCPQARGCETLDGIGNACASRDLSLSSIGTGIEPVQRS